METTTATRMPIWLPILLVLIGGVFYVAGQNVVADNSARDMGTISVTGQGRAFAVPDIAEISLGVQTGRQPTAAKAMEELKDAMDKVLDAVRELDVSDADIRTENFWLNPVYDYTEGRQIPRGFEANQSLRVKIRDLEKVSAVLGAATNAGANQAGNVQFTVDDPDQVQAEAREEAIEEAKQKAKELAKQLGVSLDEIVGFSEGYGGGMPVPMMRMEGYGMGGGAADAAVQLPAGEQEVTVSVTIVYDLED